jgi:glucose-1-phosphate thymidylyltransferase
MSKRSAAPPARRAVGLVPAAGSATRLGALPCSKEILPLPVSDRSRDRAGDIAAVRPVMARLLDAFSMAGVERAIVVVRADKWDVPRALGALDCGVDLAYVVVEETPSPVHSLARAAPFLGESVVALGFPDILFSPHDAYADTLDRLEAGAADVVLGLFPTDRCEKTDMVGFDDTGEEEGTVVVRELVIKQPPRGLRFTWSIAVWRPRFTEVLVKAAAAAPRAPLHVGEVLGTALARGLLVEGVRFDDGEYLDIGTPDDLLAAMARRW